MICQDNASFCVVLFWFRFLDFFFLYFVSSFCPGYYLATLEAATQHILDLAAQYETVASVDHMFDNGEDIYDEDELVD